MVNLVHLDYKVCLVMMEGKETKAPKDTEVYSGCKDYQARLDLLVTKDQLAIMVSMANLVNKDLEVHQVWTEMLVLLVYQALPVPEDLKVKKENAVLEESVDLQGLQDLLERVWASTWPLCQQ